MTSKGGKKLFKLMVKKSRLGSGKNFNDYYSFWESEKYIIRAKKVFQVLCVKLVNYDHHKKVQKKENFLEEIKCLSKTMDYKGYQKEKQIQRQKERESILL